MNSLLQKLSSLGEGVNELTGNSINFGGCAVYAAAVATRLQELGITAECVVPADFAGVHCVEQARNNLYADGNNGDTAREWAEAGLNFHHVGVRFKLDGQWFTHDTDSLLADDRCFGEGGEYAAMDDGLTPEEATRIADDPRGWNSTFDRGYIPAVREMVREYLQ